jgi:hypothetical protein
VNGVLRMSSPKPKSCYICNYTSAAFRSGYNSSMPRAVFKATCCVQCICVCEGKTFHCGSLVFIANVVCNACVECNLNHFIVYLIIYANLCLQCTMVKCYALG